MSQFLLRLTRTITMERGHSLICFPDRTTADYELYQLKNRLGPRLIKAAIRKDKPGPGSNYTCAASPGTPSPTALFDRTVISAFSFPNFSF